MKHIVNEYGEYEGEIRDGDRILRKESREFLETHEEVKYKKFVIMNHEEIDALWDELDPFTMGLLMKMINAIKYENNMVAFNNGKPVTSESMARFLGVGRNKAYDSVSKLLKLNILVKVENSREKQYYLNPYIAHKGKYVQKVLSDMFRHYKKRT
jgi:predicted transcriptional regulator